MLHAISYADLSDFVEEEDDDRDTWHVLMAPNEVRVFSLEQLDDTFRLGLIDERTLVWRPSLVEWTELERVIDEAEPEDDPEVWHALVGPGRVVEGTLDQLDHAYQTGAINERTLVWRPGMTEWMPLGVMAGIDFDARPAPTPTTAHALSAPPSSGVRSVVPTAVPSVVPIAFSVPPYVETRSWAERWLFGAALVATAALVLYRNDFVYQAAVAAGKAAYVEQAEQRAFGGPVFGTSRSVSELIQRQHIDYSRIAIPVMLEDQQRAAERDAAAEQARQDREQAAALAKRKADELDALRKKVAEAQAAQKKVDDAHAADAERVGAALQGKPSPVHAAPAPRKTTKGSTEGDVIPGVKANGRRGSDYDPLNPNL